MSELNDESSDEACMYHFLMDLSKSQESLGHPDPWDSDCCWLDSFSSVGVSHLESPLHAVVTLCGHDFQGEVVS